MDKIFLNNQVLAYFLEETLSLVISFVALFIAIKILLKWDFNSFSQTQFKLENSAYLVSTIVLFLLFIKIISTLFFVYTIDSLSILVPGAMCAAGVISANDYGLNLLLVKLITIFLLLLWVNLNSYDIKAKNYPIIKHKQILYIAIFISIALEFYLSVQYFSNINLNQPVSCCSTLYGQLEGANPLPFGLNITMLLALFYLLFVSFLLATFSKMNYILIIVSVLFLYISYYSVVYFFGTYIYELPTHKCPFCMMQKEYYYVGYLVWGSLFLGTFLAIIYSIIDIWLKYRLNNAKKASIYLISFFVLICSYYVLSYYIKNGVLL